MLNANAYSFVQNWHLLIQKLLQKNLSTDKRKKKKTNKKKRKLIFFLGVGKWQCIWSFKYINIGKVKQAERKFLVPNSPIKEKETKN